MKPRKYCAQFRIAGRRRPRQPSQILPTGSNGLALAVSSTSLCGHLHLLAKTPGSSLGDERVGRRGRYTVRTCAENMARRRKANNRHRQSSVNRRAIAAGSSNGGNGRGNATDDGSGGQAGYLFFFFFFFFLLSWVWLFSSVVLRGKDGDHGIFPRYATPPHPTLTHSHTHSDRHCVPPPARSISDYMPAFVIRYAVGLLGMGGLESG